MFSFLFGFASIQAEKIPDGIMPQKRQVVGTGGSTSSPADSTPVTSNQPQSTSSPQDNSPSTTAGGAGGDSTSVPITTTNNDGSTVTRQVPASSVTSDGGAVGGGGVQTTKGTSDDNSVVKVGSTTVNPKTLDHKTTVKEPLVSKTTRHSSYTSYYTSNGQVRSTVVSTENVFASTTGFATATIAPSLANAGGDGSNLSDSTKKIIGGVVGGIGGAILIGGLAFVAWRLWGKKKQEQQQEDMYSNDSLSAQKRYSENTLMTDAAYSTNAPYSNSSRPVNTASNF